MSKQSSRISNTKQKELVQMTHALSAPTIAMLRTIIYKAGKVLILSAFDGVLAEIVSQPQEAKIDRNILRILNQPLDPKVTIGLISGRELADLRGRVGIDGLILAGSHGMETDIHGHTYQSPVLPAYESLVQALIPQVDHLKTLFPGAYIEKKRFGFCVHSRKITDSQQKAQFETMVSELLSPFKKQRLIAVISGRSIQEVKPPGSAHKGSALELIIARLSLDTRRPIVVIYLGDDRTDEQAFRVLKRPCQMGIKVLSPENTAKTKALYYLNNISEVARFLQLLLESGFSNALNN